MAEAFKPFDRQALEATLADALKDASPADGEMDTDEHEAPGAHPSGPPRAANPFGRPNAPGGSIPAPASVPRPSTPAVPPRTGPSILAGGISAGLAGSTPMGGLGGASVSGFRAPEPGRMGLGGSGLGARPLSPLGRISSEEPVEPTPTISLRRPTRPQAPAAEPAAPAAPAQPAGSVAASPAAPVGTPGAPPDPAPADAPAPQSGSRSMMPLAGWSASDDDILPRSAGGRRRSSGRGRANKPGPASKSMKAKVRKPQKS